MCSIMGYIGSRLTEDDFKLGFERTVSRGPDMSRIVKLNNGLLGFHRLAIMGLTDKGMQPFTYKNNMLVCNGEIYGFRPIKDELIKKGYTFESDSDCEILLPLYEQYGIGMFSMLDAEFALIIYDGETKDFIAARDPIGIRPLYYGYDKDGGILFASEPKNLVGLADKIMPFPPGHYYKDGRFYCYNDIAAVDEVCYDDLETVCKNIHDKLAAGVEKRLDADTPVG
ncbi:MAG: asparagine synthetase B, partial [Acutalibacteraceae bacterium]